MTVTPERALKLIAEGYFSEARDDRFIAIENPNYRPDDGSDPFIVVDVATLAAQTDSVGSQDHIDIVAFAIRAEFIKSIERSSGKAFSESGVDVPDFSIWERYARAAIAAQAQSRERTTASVAFVCDICGRDSRPDTIVSNEEWARISPTGDSNGNLCAACMVSRLGYIAAMIVDAHAQSGETEGGTPPPSSQMTFVDINAVIALVKDSGEDAQPDSEYRRACDDLVEALSEQAIAPQTRSRGPELRAHHEIELNRIIEEWEQRRDVLLADPEAKARFLVLRSFELASTAPEASPTDPQQSHHTEKYDGID